jgi:hypothetical protein
MTRLNALELQNDTNTRMVQLTRNCAYFYIRPTVEHSWIPVTMDEALAKEAIRLVSSTKKDASLRSKLQVRENAVANLVALAAPSISPMDAMTVKLTAMA